MSAGRVETALEIIAAIQSLSDIRSAMLSIRGIYNLDHIAYCASGFPGAENEKPYLIMTYPTEWVERYRRENFHRIDPVVIAARGSVLAVDWATLDHKTPAARYLFDEAERYGIGRQGISLPIHGPCCETGLLTFTSNLDETNWSRLRRLYDGELILLAHHLHDRAIRILADRQEKRTRPQPTPRERECLQLVAEGLAPKQIARKLDLSEAAVRLYLKRVRARLGATSLTHAVVMALRFNMIHS